MKGIYILLLMLSGLMWRINRTQHTATRHMVTRVPPAPGRLGGALLLSCLSQRAACINARGMVPDRGIENASVLTAGCIRHAQ